LDWRAVLVEKLARALTGAERCGISDGMDRRSFFGGLSAIVAGTVGGAALAGGKVAAPLWGLPLAANRDRLIYCKRLPGGAHLYTFTEPHPDAGYWRALVSQNWTPPTDHYWQENATGKPVYL
jgi:hypothetical protein